MKRKAVSGMALMLLLTSMLSSAFIIQPVKAAGGTIYIRADGAVDPATAPIQRDGDIYIFTDNIYDSIVVERSNIIIDGAGYTLEGSGYPSKGFNLNGSERVRITNVTITKTNIKGFYLGFYFYYSSYNIISGNNITGNTYGIWLSYSSRNTFTDNNISNNSYKGIHAPSGTSHNNTFTGNRISNNLRGIYLGGSNKNTFKNNIISLNTDFGIGLEGSHDNVLSGNIIDSNTGGSGIYFFGSTVVGPCTNNILTNNTVLNNRVGISLHLSKDNILANNTVISNNEYGIVLTSSTNNKIYHNNLLDNGQQVYSCDSANVWDDGYPSGGNYWSDYTGVDVDGDGIGDTPYIIDANNRDRYPLMNHWTPTPLLAESPWPKFRHDVQNTGRSLYTGPETPELKWSFPVGGVVYSSPAIGDDGTVYIGSQGNSLYAINPDGSEKWSFATEGEVFSSPAIGADGTIYVGAHNTSLHYDGRYYAINPDGTEKWRFEIGNRVYSSPTIGTDGTIYAGAGGLDLNLYAINTDGSQKWRFTTSGGTHGSPAIGTDGTIYISSGGIYGNIYAINPDGTEKWSSNVAGRGMNSPAIGADGTIYAIAYGYGLVAINPDGTKKWGPIYVGSTDAWASPAIGADGTIYVGSLYSNALYAINANGTGKWNFGAASWVQSSPAVGADGTIYVGSHDGKLYAINPDGTEKWSFATGGQVFSSPAIGADGTIYVGSGDGKLYAIGEAAPPTVSSVTPEDGATDVAVNAVVTATFTEAMDSSTITSGSFTLAGSVVSGTVEYDPATYTAAFAPDANLDYDHTYTATLSTAITDLAGNPLAESYTWSFTTETAPPQILSVPYYYQGDTGWCMPTSMSMVFKYYNQNIHSWDIAKDWDWGRDDIPFFEPSRSMVDQYFYDHGLLTSDGSIAFDTIAAWIDAGMPVIVQVSWWEWAWLPKITHAVVIVGYDRTGVDKVYIHDPGGRLTRDKLGLSEYPHVAVEVNWADIIGTVGSGLIDWIMAVYGTPQPPKGTIDVYDTGTAFSTAWGMITRWPYGRDKGLIWKDSPYEIPPLNPDDRFLLINEHIVNHMKNDQTYRFVIEFAKYEPSVSLWVTAYSDSWLVSVEAGKSTDRIWGPTALRDILSVYGEYMITLRLLDETGTEEYDEIILPAIKYSPGLVFKMASPANLYVTDPHGRHVGVNPYTGEVVNDIPGAVYTGPGSEPQVIAISDPLDGNYMLEVIGTAQGNYSLTAQFVTLPETMAFVAIDIPTTTGAVHQYTIDWDALSRGEEGVTVQVDSDGDGITDHTLTAGNVLTGDEFVPRSGCFIATAAYGTRMAEEIQILREFRDECLLTNPVGRVLVDFYYRVSSPIAEFITEHPGLKPMVRVGLVPAVAMSTVVVNAGPVEKTAMLGLLALVSLVVAIWVIRRRGGGLELPRGEIAH